MAATLRTEGLDVCVAGASAYSTLGWFDDPVLSSMTRRPDSQLIATLIHELAHQAIHVGGAPEFNEAFAETVATEGVRRWYRTHGPPEAFERYARGMKRRCQFQALLAKTRDALAKLYAQALPAEAKRREKTAPFRSLRASYRQWKKGWGGYRGYDAWMAQPLNNAHLASMATCHRLEPAFRRLLAQSYNDLPRFYQTVRRLAHLSPSRRSARLARLNEAGTPAAS